jgi:hypothetical protein
MKNIIDRFKKRLRENRGYLIMESAFVYPIMFFILMFLIYMGNMFYLKAKVDAIVTQEAQTYAEKFADPNLESFSSSIPTSTSGDTEVTSELYRYIDVFNLSDYGVATSSEKQDLKSRLQDTGFFSGMAPSNIKVVTHQVHNYIIYQTYEVSVDYEFKFPIKFIFQDDYTVLDMSVTEEAPIVDTPEFIRNVDMAVDYLQQSEKASEVGTKLTSAYDKIDNFINGEKYSAEDAVAGGVLSDQYERIKRRVVLKPNYTYTSNGYTYSTDSNRRIVSAGGTLRLESADRNEYAQSQAGREDREDGDDGGHLIASMFGGSGNLDNLVAMSSSVNRSPGEWYKMEQEWKNQLEKTPAVTVEVSIEIVYSGDSQRPESFIVNYSYDGVPQETKIIENK